MSERNTYSRFSAETRAIPLIARSFYGELVRANYSAVDMMRMASELLDLIARGNKPDRTAVLSLVDAQSGLPSQDVLLGIIAFELRHVRHAIGRSTLTVLSLEIDLPQACPSPALVHEKLIRQLRACMRSTDSLGLLNAGHYLLILRDFTTEQWPQFESRLAVALHAALHDVEGLAVNLRSCLEVGENSPSEVIKRCLAAPARQLALTCGAPASRVQHSDGTQSEQKRSNRIPTTKKEVVLALGGGAARAASHAGVLRALAATRLKVAGISGTSAGALAAAMYATGNDTDDIVRRFSEFAESSLYRAMRTAYAKYLSSSARFSFSKRLYREIGIIHISEAELAAIPGDLYRDFIGYFAGVDRDISTLDVPFSTCATDLSNGKLYTFAFGSLHDALRAACAVPGLFPPQAIGQRLFVDASLITDLPVDAARQLARATPLVGVSLAGSRKSRHTFRNSAEVFSRYVSSLRDELAREQARRVDFMISLPVQDCGWFSFHEASRIATSGERATSDALTNLLPRIEAA